MKYVKLHKPGTKKTQSVEADRVDFYRQYGWEPIDTEVKAVLRPSKKKTEIAPAVDAAPDVASDKEGEDTIQGE